MKKMNGWLFILAGIACMSICSASAQDNGTGGFGGGRGGFGAGNFDAAQMQQQLQETRLNNYRNKLEISDDAKWAMVKEKIQKVLDVKQAATLNPLISELSGIFGMLGRNLGGANPGAGGGGTADAGAGGMARRNMANLIALTPEEDALQKAIDSKASGLELKAALTKVTEARKAQQTKIEKAQEELRKVLTTRQEAIAMLNGLL
jgi:hypothetical protein